MMILAHPEIDLTGTIHDLDLLPLPAHILGRAAARVLDPAFRALAVTLLLAHHPHKIRCAADRKESGYHLPGGRALRAAVMVRALDFVDGAVAPAINEQLLTATLLGNLAHPGPHLDVSTRRAWMERIAADESDHLVNWFCTRARARHLIDLAGQAGELHPEAPRDTWLPTTDPERRLVLACRAAQLARPLHPESGGNPVPLPGWMDPELSVRQASQLFRVDRGMIRALRPCRRPGLAFRALPEGSVLSH